MYEVKYARGYFNITGDIDETRKYTWVTHNDSKFLYYFLPNPTTRRLFAKEMLGDPNMVISNSDKELLRTFDMSGYIGKYTKPLIVPELGANQTLMPHQVTAVYKMLEHKNYCLFLGPGTGKTLIAITYLINAKPNKVLIITPKNVVDQYSQEIAKYLNYKPDITITNFGQIRAKPKYMIEEYDCVIIDESHKYKDYMSKEAIIVREHMHIKQMFLFTGTPQDRTKLEIFSQFALFDKRFMPTKSKFQERYFQLDQFFNPTIEKLPAELDEMMKLVSYGAKTEDLILLTDIHENVIKCEKPKEYEALFKDKLIAEPDFTLICDTPSKLAIKLRQMCNGFLLDDKGNVRDYNTDKTKELCKLIPKLKNGIIYTMFDNDIDVVSKVLDSLNRTYRVVNGKTNKDVAKDNIREFKTKSYDFLVIQSASGKEGLDLTNTNNIVFFSLPPSFITFEQCKHRIRRKGQDKDCNYYYLVCKGTVENHILQLLKQKKGFNANLYSIYKTPTRTGDDNGTL